MKSMRARLNNIADMKNQFTLKENTVLDVQIIDENRQTFSAPETVVLGRNEERNQIVNKIINKQTSGHIYVIPIFGMGGLGKTTLAKSIFNDSKLRDSKKFDVWAWAYIGSKDFHLCNTGSRIISSLKNSQFNCDNLEIINQEMKKELNGKRFLIVLDDVWNVNIVLWDQLINMLINSSKGGTIVVTTRIKKTATDIASDVPYPLNTLSDDNCILLFQQKAFQSKDEMNKYPNLVSIGEAIATKCGGVALVANTLGSMLRSERDEKNWSYVRDSETWQLHEENIVDSSNSAIVAGLLLSYNLMPAKLKPCFAYCSTYPKGHRISSHKLVQHWISLNFIRSDSSRNSSLSLHDIAQVELEKLISLSFLQRSEEIDNFGNNVVLMHDLMHDLANHVAKDHDIKNFDDMTIAQDVNENSHRYLSIYGLKEASYLSQIDVADGKIRAISLYSDNVKLKDKSFPQARSLRVLEAEGLEINLPKKLKQLRYFSASHISKEISLPNLQFLNLVGAQFEALPESVCNFKTLLNLNLSSCQNLSTLPESISNLENLSHLDLSHYSKLEKLPESFGHLKSLQYLNFSNCPKLATLPEPICNLQKLSHLDLSWCYKLGEIPESFGNLKSLQHLYLSYCENLVTLPESIGNLQKLKHLDLSRCTKLQQLPESFGNLKSLQHLYLSDCENLVTLPESIGNLQKLLHLDLSWCSRLQNLPECFANIESLQYLNLSHCDKLKKLPECFGNLRSLQYLILSKCKNVETLPESFVNLQNLLHLHLLCCYTSYCHKFGKLPERFSNLKSLERLELETIDQVQEYLPGLLIDLNSLRHLVVPFLSPPLSTSSMKLIRRLAKFETLRLDLDFKIKEEEEDAEEGKCCSIICLENLNMLEGALTLWGLEKVKDPTDAKRANLKQKHKVSSLELVWNDDDAVAAAVLQNLQPSPNLQHMEIIGYGGRQWPTWTIDHLKELTLEKIPRLNKIEFGRSQFPSLQKLYINKMEKLEQVSLMNTDGKIKELSIEECPCMTRISLPPSTTKLTLLGNVGLLLSSTATIQASSLETLCVWECEQLVALPECIGKLSSLEYIIIKKCPNIQSLPNSMRQLTQLQKLTVEGCSGAFEQECQDPKSENWSQIQHIPKVDTSQGKLHRRVTTNVRNNRGKGYKTRPL